MDEGYYLNKDEKLNLVSAEQMVRNQIRTNLIVAGGFPQAKVEEVLNSMDKIPDELVKSYIEM